MDVVFYSVVLNHHQAPVADALWELTNQHFIFVELANIGSSKGGLEDYSNRPYLLRAWESEENHSKAMNFARTADCCVFSGVHSLPYLKERLILGKLSFDMGERWLKQGLKNIFSPAISRMLLTYWFRGWRNMPLYKLCCSAFAKEDQEKLGTYIGKCYKWGYFTKTLEGINVPMKSPSGIVRLMWCARFLKLKHPELPTIMAARLKKKGYSFILDYYGNGEELEPTQKLVEEYNLNDIVRFHGSVPNNQVLEAMSEHDILLFTSNRLEGWGAVVNEALSMGCAVVGSDAVGSMPYLVEDGVNGFSFEEGNVDSLCEKVSWLIEHPIELRKMQERGVLLMRDIWSPQNAAKALLRLIDDLQHGKENSISEGPCSNA